jgi:hypothetical protein
MRNQATGQRLGRLFGLTQRPMTESRKILFISLGLCGALPHHTS